MAGPVTKVYESKEKDERTTFERNWNGLSSDAQLEISKQLQFSLNYCGKNDEAVVRLVTKDPNNFTAKDALEAFRILQGELDKNDSRGTVKTLRSLEFEGMSGVMITQSANSFLKLVERDNEVAYAEKKKDNSSWGPKDTVEQPIKVEYKLAARPTRVDYSKKEPKLVKTTEIALYPTVDKSMDRFYEGLKTAKEVRLERGTLVFSFDGGKEIEVSLKDNFGIDFIFTPGVMKKGVDFVVGVLEKNQDNLGSVWFTKGTKSSLMYDSDKALASVNDVGVTRATRLALSFDFYLTPDGEKAQKFYAKDENKDAAQEVYRKAFEKPKGLVPSEFDAYMYTYAVQAKVGMSDEEQDGLAGSKTKKKVLGM